MTSKYFLEPINFQCLKDTRTFTQYPEYLLKRNSDSGVPERL